ncbi:hypothetical protein QJS10_CPB14g01620 [Acorus calamus]|uniref:Uncharacterized protein n=1 Tax=Acorus calamus TaxID=4465 RepID=A0AAV9DE63_ACOCL|nr:hypothetical protein QJS10_CPB14g01620 [Acorus calamus]
MSLYLEKERLHVPDSRYVYRVFSCSGLLCGRFRAVQWILKVGLGELDYRIDIDCVFIDSGED